MSMGSRPWSRELGHVVRLVAAGQQRGEDDRVEGLDPPAQDLGGVGEIGDRPDLEPALGQVGTGAIGREELDPRIGQAARKLENAFTVTD